MTDTHDERGGDEDVVTPEKAAFELRYWLDTRTGTDRLGRDVGIVLDALAAVTARAETAEAEAGRLSDVNYHVNQGAVFYQQKYDEVVRERDQGRAAAAVYAANDKLRTERDEARARLAELTLLRLEWSTANCYSDLGDDIVSERLARDRVASRPEIHAAVVSRQIYAGPWREGACRSCGTDERVLGDPPLCSNCAVFGATYRGVACWPPVASPEALSGPVERSETSGGSVQGNTSSILPQGLSEAEGGCPWCGTLQKLDADGLVLPHEHPTYCDECPGSTRRPNNDTPEDGQHG